MDEAGQAAPVAAGAKKNTRQRSQGEKLAQLGSSAAARIENVGFLLADVTRLMRKGFDRRVRALGLSRPQWRVLLYVLQNEGLSQSALAKRLDMERAPLGQLVHTLIGARLVRRERSDTDQREQLIFADEGAHAVLPALTEAAEWLRELSIAGISQEDQALFRQALERMRSNLSSAVDG